MRVVASLTTMPDRYDKLSQTLNSLHNQTYKLDAIYLGVPHKSKRLDIEYPPLPDTITKQCTVVRCPDYGPITKIVGALMSESDPNTVIITFDDDRVYHPDLVEKLIQHHQQYPNAAIGSSGMLLKYACPMCAITPNEDNMIYRIPKFSVPPQGRKVDSVYGYPGALYVRKFFPFGPPSKKNGKSCHSKKSGESNTLTQDMSLLEEKFLNYALINMDTFLNDDIMISGYLSTKKIGRMIFPDMPIADHVLDHGVRVRTTNEISYDLDLFFKRLNSAVTAARKAGMYQHTEDVAMTETIVGVTAIMVISILILIAAVIWILRQNEPFL
jgi:hypothetical protein